MNALSNKSAQCASARTFMGSFPVTSASGVLVKHASDIQRGTATSYPWNTLVDLRRQAAKLCYKMDAKFYLQMLYDTRSIAQVQAMTPQPTLVLIRNDVEAPAPPDSLTQGDVTIDVWKKSVQLPEEFEWWRACERTAPSLRSLLLCPSVGHLKYYHQIVHGGGVWNKQYCLGYVRPREWVAYPGNQVRSVVSSVGIESWVVAFIDAQVAKRYYEMTQLVPAAGGGLEIGGQIFDAQFWLIFREVHANYFRCLASKGHPFGAAPYYLNRIKFDRYKYHVHAMYPGVVFATVPLWLECSELIDTMFYLEN